MLPQKPRWRLAVAVLAATMALAHAAEEEPKRRLKSNPLQEYWVYLPSNFDPEKRYWLFVAVHGLDGKGQGALGWEKFADEGQCIVVGPTFVGGHQFPTATNEHGKNMVAIFKELSQQYKLQRKLFLTGFSAGAQFAHRFTFAFPQFVVGCAAHSAGSWSNPNSKARSVPFVVTCGEDDKTRINLARGFAVDLKGNGYKVTAAWYPTVAHSMCNEARELTQDLYWSSTTGMTVEERQKAVAALEEGEKLFNDGKFADAYQALITLTKAKRKNEFSERAASTLRQIAKLGAGRLADAEEQSKTDVDAAIKALEQMQDDFKGFRVARAAASLLTKLKGGAGPTKPEPKVADKPDEKPTEMASPSEPPKKAAPAQAAQAARWMRMAKNFLANKRKDAAKRYLEMVITQCPETDEAGEAKLMLMEMEMK